LLRQILDEKKRIENGEAVNPNEGADFLSADGQSSTPNFSDI
jgi:hypothetical protein